MSFKELVGFWEKEVIGDSWLKEWIERIRIRNKEGDWLCIYLFIGYLCDKYCMFGD